MPDSLTIELPWPPSKNRLRATIVIKGRPRTLLSTDARLYYAAISRLIVAKKIVPISGRVCVDIVLHPPDRRMIDPANYLEAILDSIKRRFEGKAVKGKPRKFDPSQKGWLFAKDDSQAVDGSWKLRHIIPGGKCIVTLTKIPSELQEDLFNAPTLTKDEMKFAKQIIKETEKYPQSERIA